MTTSTQTVRIFVTDADVAAITIKDVPASAWWNWKSEQEKIDLSENILYATAKQAKKYKAAIEKLKS